MKEVLLHREGLRGFINNARREVLNSLSACAFAVDFSHLTQQSTLSVSILPLEPWQVTLLRLGVIAFVSGGYAQTVANTLRNNEGRTRLQRRLGNIGLIINGAGVAAIDTVVASVPF